MPSIEAAQQRAHARDSPPAKQQRRTGARGLGRSSAIKDDVPIARNLLVPAFNLVEPE
jgi:hypothetical protein